jgi:hypothetical protein
MEGIALDATGMATRHSLLISCYVGDSALADELHHLGECDGQFGQPGSADGLVGSVSL